MYYPRWASWTLRICNLKLVPTEISKNIPGLVISNWSRILKGHKDLN